MNIGMILDKSFPPDNRVEKEIKSLTKNNFSVYLLCFSYDDGSLFTEFEGAKIIRIKANRNLTRKLRALTNTIFDYYTEYWTKKIIEFVKKYRINTLHIHDLYLIGAGLRAKEILDNKVLVFGDLHENYADALKYYKFSNTFPGNILISISKWKKIEQDWISKLDGAVVVVKEMKERISNYIDPHNIIICENCPELDQLNNYKIDKSIDKKYQGKYVISYIGGFDWHRGIETLIRAMEILKKIDDIVLCIVGNGKNYKELLKLSRKLKITDKVIFEGWKAHDVLPNYFRISDIGVIPHLKSIQTDNSSPNKLYEYMYLKTPVVASNCRSIARIIDETGAGLIYESGNYVELAKQIRKIYYDTKLQEDMKIKGEKAINNKYNWMVCSKDLIKMYNNIDCLKLKE